MNISKYILVVLSVAVVMPNIACAMEQNQAEHKGQAQQQEAEKKEAGNKANIDSNQIPWKKVGANIVATGVGAISGYALKKLWVDTDGGLIWTYIATCALLWGPGYFAKEIGASVVLTNIATTSSAVFTHAFKK